MPKYLPCLLWLLLWGGYANASNGLTKTDAPLIPRRGEKVEFSAHSPLSAPYVVEFVKGNKIIVDLGENPTAPKVMTIIDRTQGSIEANLLKTDRHWDRPCPNHPEKVAHYVGIYQARGVKFPIATFAGTHQISLFKKSDITNQRSESPKTLRIKKYPDHTDLLEGMTPILRSVDDYNTPDIEMLVQFKIKDQTYYLARVALKIEDTVGLLFNNGEKWEFLYRTVEPMGRRTVCD